MDGLLITFGCSWMKGIGASYVKGMSKADYLNNVNLDKTTENSPGSNDCFRKLLSEKYKLENINFSFGGASNQSQFRLAEKFFISRKFKDYKKQYENIIVLWGITSIFRREFFNVKSDDYKSYMLSNNRDITRIILNEYHNDEEEIKRLRIQMQHWNNHFEYLGLKNIWFDTFNHHDYKGHIRNMCFAEDSPRDLLSKLLFFKEQDSYHKSDWIEDSDRIKMALQRDLINPYSLHPVQKTHREIANLLDPFVRAHIRE